MPIPKWGEITREERYFTAILFQEIAANYLPFWELIRPSINNSKDVEIVDVGYEVCMLRDLAHGGHIQRQYGSEKQTFDLVLTLSDASIVIIEAKAHQCFLRKQIDNMEKSASFLLHNVNLGLDSIHIVGVHSSKYTPKAIMSEYPHIILRTWADLANLYPNNKSVFQRANEIYMN